MKIITGLILMSLTGCASAPVSDSASHGRSRGPDMLTRPDESTRRAIMSGERPDWSKDQQSLRINW